MAKFFSDKAKYGVLVLLILAWAGLAYIEQGKPKSSEVEGINLPQFKAVSSPFAVFFTDAEIPEKSSTYVSFPYYFTSPHQPLFLNLQMTPEAKPVIILVDHPIIPKIENWSKISSERLVLYQKEAKYKSVEEFIKAGGGGEKVIADPVLIYNKEIMPNKNVISLDEWKESDQFEYFFTTYHTPSNKGYYSLFEAKVDANQGLLRECPQNDVECKPTLMWKLDMPTVTPDNILFIGEVHVDFRQAK